METNDFEVPLGIEPRIFCMSSRCNDCCTMEPDNPAYIVRELQRNVLLQVSCRAMKGPWLDTTWTSRFVKILFPGNIYWSRRTKYIRWGRTPPSHNISSVLKRRSQGRISNRALGPGLGQFSARSCKIECSLGLERVYYGIAWGWWSLRSWGLEATLDEQTINYLFRGFTFYHQITSPSGASS